MTGRRKRTAAAMPAAGYRRPAMLGDDGLTVSVVGEDGRDFGCFDFTSVEAPAELMRALVAEFARASGPGGRWKSPDTMRTTAQALRRFAREVAAANPQVATVGDVTPEMWWGWCAAIEARWPNQIKRARALLKDIEGVPDLTRRAMYHRGAKPTRTYVAYSRGEFSRIRSAAWRVVDAARSRIESNVEILARYRAGETTADREMLRTQQRLWSRGEWLDHLSRTGEPPQSRAREAEVTGANRSAVGVSGPLQEALFLNGGEVFALMALFVCKRGYNGSVLNSMTVSGGRADDHDVDDPVYLAELDKPRRGAARDFWNSYAGASATLWETALALTQPARETLAALGHPTDELFIAVTVSNRTIHPTGLFLTDWSNNRGGDVSAWSGSVQVTGDDGHPLPVTLSRLRLSEQVLNQRASQNSEAVSARIYRYPDPQTHAAARKVVLQGQADAVEHAQATVQMRTVSQSELTAARSDPTDLAAKLGIEPTKVALLAQGRLDTATGACTNYHASPFAEPGEPCRVSFLNCLGCPNAVATQAHLPRLVVLHDALVAISEVVSRQEWDKHYARHLARLEDLLSQGASDAEIAQARDSATPADIDTVETLLRGGYDR